MISYQLMIACLLISLLVHVYGNLISASRNALESKHKSSCQVCDCVGLTADCSSRNIASLPQELPRDITVLRLYNNCITHLPDGLLGQLYQNLEVLDIDLNKIAIFGNHTFTGLVNLQYLMIGKNPFKPESFHKLVYKPLENIRTIQVNGLGDESKLDSRIALFDAFEGLQNSTIEAIIYKQITLMPFVLENKHLRYFKHCHLKKMVLAENGIFATEPGFSHNMPQLEMIDLSSNILRGRFPGTNIFLTFI
ncbi:unnamed protein product [Owenia fusiformis]|uniref:LRRNT domain-containing protein n=1 Tax=Owenia fusiformis TaxID=6347 RepID=A0A8S4MY97_OWEFU|nr:unnamed protein product [Owenia fusiformis]